MVGDTSWVKGQGNTGELGIVAFWVTKEIKPVSQQGGWTQRGWQEPETWEEEEISGDCEGIKAQGFLG